MTNAWALKSERKPAIHGNLNIEEQLQQLESMQKEYLHRVRRTKSIFGEEEQAEGKYDEKFSNFSDEKEIY